MVGECFVHMENDAAEDRLTLRQDVVSGDLAKASDELGSIKTEMSTLKDLLYNKFGNSINLEEGDEEKD